MKTLRYSFMFCLFMSLIFTSCDKDSLGDGELDTQPNPLLTLDDLQVGESYDFDQLHPSVFEILEIDRNNKARTTYYKILQRAEDQGGCTGLTITYPNGTTTVDLDATNLLWQKNSSLNGTYSYEWTGSSCSDLDGLYIHWYTITSGQLTTVNEYWSPEFTGSSGATGSILFSDGGWDIGGSGGMDMD